MFIDSNGLYIFKDLDSETAKRLSAISSVSKIKKDDILFYEKEESRYLHFLVSGGLRLYKTTQKGLEVVLHDLYGPTLVAELANFNKTRFPATAKALSECKIVKIDFEMFYNDIISDPGISMFIIKSLLGKLKIVENFIDMEITKSADAKVSIMLLDNLDFFNKSKQSNVAKLLNITPETLSRVLGKLKSQAIIEQNGKHFEVLNKEALQKICDNEWV